MSQCCTVLCTPVDAIKDSSFSLEQSLFHACIDGCHIVHKCTEVR